MPSKQNNIAATLQQCCVIFQQYCIATLLQHVLVDTPLRCSNVACNITVQCCWDITTISNLILHILVTATSLQYCIATVAGMLQQYYIECCSNVSLSLSLNIAVMLNCNTAAMLPNAMAPFKSAQMQYSLTLVEDTLHLVALPAETVSPSSGN